MKNFKPVRLVFAAIIIAALSSFSTTTDPFIKSGVYGSCVCDNAGAPIFELTLNEDQSFRYEYNADPKNKIDVTGNWTMEGRFIRLTGYPEGLKIHDRWKADKNPDCIRSRKGMEFSRLCLKNCK